MTSDTTQSAAADDADRVDAAVDSRETRSAWRRYGAALGPGLVTGASDDDPSGIATYAQAGTQFRYATLWTVVLTFPLMVAVQEICDRTALATGDSLGKLVRVKVPQGPPNRDRAPAGRSTGGQRAEHCR